jgi:hypothetical protein
MRRFLHLRFWHPADAPALTDAPICAFLRTGAAGLL